MKADRRHELQENELVHMLESARTNLAQNAKPIGLGVLAVVVVLIVASLAVRSRSVASEDRWRRLGQLMFDKPETAKESFETLGTLSKSTSHREFVLATLLEQERQALTMAQRPDSFPDRELMEHASSAFNRLLAEFSDNPLAVGVAHCGLATVAENMYIITRQSKFQEEARKHLDAVVKDSKLDGLPFQRIAIERIATLDQTFRFVEFGPSSAQAAAPGVRPLQPSEVPSLALPGGQGPKIDVKTVPVAPPSDTTGPMDFPTEEGVDTADTVPDEPEPPKNP